MLKRLQKDESFLVVPVTLIVNMLHGEVRKKKTNLIKSLQKFKLFDLRISATP